VANAGFCELLAARALVRAGRREEAASLYRASIETLVDGGLGRYAVDAHLELADLVDSPAEAAELRATAEALA